MGNKMRLTVVFDFNYYGDVDEKTGDQLAQRFLMDPSAFMNPATLEWDETIYVDIEKREEGEEDS